MNLVNMDLAKFEKLCHRVLKTSGVAEKGLNDTLTGRVDATVQIPDGEVAIARWPSGFGGWPRRPLQVTTAYVHAYTVAKKVYYRSEQDEGPTNYDIEMVRYLIPLLEQHLILELLSDA